MESLPISPNEARLLGVLIEKAMTTPDQYPLSLNAATNGANQKNNRDPVTALADDGCFEALENLRARGLAVRVDVPGNRVHKYRHNAGDALHARPGELAVLAELMLRGPQTLGEIRGRASRMSAMDSLEVAQGLLSALMSREQPLVKQLPPSPGSRAERFMQLLSPDAHPIETAHHAAAPVAPAADRVAVLEEQVARLTAAVRKLAAALGEPDPIHEETRRDIHEEHEGHTRQI